MKRIHHQIAHAFLSIVALFGVTAAIRAQNIFVSAVMADRVIYQFTPAGAQSTFVTFPEIGTPLGLAFDPAGSLYVAFRSHTIMKITPDGTVSVVASGPELDPGDLVVDGTGNLYLSYLDGRSIISKITPSGEISTFASDPLLGGTVGLTIDAAGNIFAAVSPKNAVVRITPDGAVSLFASGPGLNYPSDLAFDAHGNLYVANYLDGTITRLTPDGTASPFSSAGSGGLTSLAFGAGGELYATNQLTRDVRKYSPDGLTSVIFASDLNFPFFIAAAPSPAVTPGRRFVSFSALSAPNIPRSSEPQACDAGSPVTLHFSAVRLFESRYQWRHNGVLIPGATQTAFSIGSFSAADEGTYDVLVSPASGAPASSLVATLVLNRPRLVNLSARAHVGTGDDVLIAGFVGSGRTSGPALLARGIGPALSHLGVAAPLAYARLSLLDSTGTALGTNEHWDVQTSYDASALRALADRLGAFALPTGSSDAELLHPGTSDSNQPPRYTTILAGADNGTGVGMIELYESALSADRLVNISARARVASGDNLLIGGFVIVGDKPLKVLVRAVGPTLATQGVATPLGNPKLTLYDVDGREIHNNDNWNQAANLADLRAATAATGAFALTENSNDAAMLETLAPGIYSAHVTSVDGSAGIALVEIYEAP